MKISSTMSESLATNTLGYFYKLTGGIDVKSLPPYFEDYGRDIIIDENGEDFGKYEGYFKDALCIAMAYITGASYNMQTDKGLDLAENLFPSDFYKIKFQKGDMDFSCNGKTVSIILDNDESESLFSGKTYNAYEGMTEDMMQELRGENEYKIVSFMQSPEVKELRENRFTNDICSRLDTLVAGIKSSNLDIKTEDAINTYNLIINSNGLLYDSLINEVVSPYTMFSCMFEKKGKQYESKEDQYLDAMWRFMIGHEADNLIPSNFEPAKSLDKVWTLTHIDSTVARECVINNIHIKPLDMYIGKKYPKMGNSTEMASNMNRYRKLFNDNKGYLSKEAKKEWQDVVIKSVTSTEDRVLNNHELFKRESELDLTKPFRSTTKEPGDEIYNREGEVKLWDSLIQEMANSGIDGMVQDMMATYKTLFEPGFVNPIFGVVYNRPYRSKDGSLRNTRRVIIKTMQSDQKMEKYLEVNGLGKHVIKYGCLGTVAPIQDETDNLFEFISKGMQSKQAFQELVKNNKSGTVVDVCEKYDDPVHLTEKGRCLDFLEDMLAYFKLGDGKLTYAPFVMSGWAFGMRCDSKEESLEYKESHRGWTEYAGYLEKDLRRIFSEATRLVVIDFACKKYGIKRKSKSTPESREKIEEEVTKRALKMGLLKPLGDSEEAYDDFILDRGEFKRACSSIVSNFKQYIMQSLLLCSMFRVLERNDTKNADGGHSLVQFRARVSDPVGVLSQPHDNLSNIVSNWVLDGFGHTDPNKMCLEETNLGVQTKEGERVNNIIEFGYLFDVAYVEGTPVFAFTEVIRNANNGYLPIWKDMALGRKFDGSPVCNNSQIGFYNTLWHLIIAGSRSGKGVMTLTALAAACMNNKGLIYLDNKPDMFSTLLSTLYTIDPELTEPTQVALFNGGWNNTRFDNVITADKSGLLPYNDRFLGYLKQGKASLFDIESKEENKKLLPSYFKGELHEREIGNLAYHRLVQLIHGVVFYKAMTSTDTVLNDAGDLVIIIDEYNQYLNSFNNAIAKFYSSIMPQEDKVLSALDKALEVAKKEKATKKRGQSEPEMTEDEAVEWGFNNFTKKYKRSIGPFNYYSLAYLETEYRNYQELVSLKNAGGNGGTLPPELCKEMDIFIIGQHATLEPMRPVENTSFKEVFGERYQSVENSGIKSGVKGDNFDIKRLSNNFFLTGPLGNGTDACFGYHADEKWILNQRVDGSKSPAKSKLTETARYFAYLPNGLDVLSDLPYFSSDRNQVAKMDDFANKATYFKPYLILNDNSHAYTDSLTATCIQKSHVSRASLFGKYGDEETRDYISKNDMNSEIESNLMHTEKERKSNPDKHTADYDDGVGLMGYMDVISETINSHLDDIDAPTTFPSDSAEALKTSFRKGASLLQKVVETLGYKGSWLQFLYDMRIEWMFTINDITQALQLANNMTVPEENIKCQGHLRSLGKEIPANWIDIYYPNYSEFTPKPYLQSKGIKATSSVNTESIEIDETPQDGESVIYGGFKGINQNIYEDSNTLEESIEGDKEISIDSKGAEPYIMDQPAPKPLSIQEQTDQAFSKDYNEMTHGDLIKIIESLSRQIAQLNTNYAQMEACLKAQQTQNKPAEPAVYSQPDEPIIYEEPEPIQPARPSRQTMQTMPSRQNQVNTSIGRHARIPEPPQPLKRTKRIQQIADRIDLNDIKFSGLKPETDSERVYQENWDDYHEYTTMARKSRSQGIVTAGQGQIVVRSMLMKPITQAVYNTCNGAWSNLKVLVITAEGQMKLDGVLVKVHYNAEEDRNYMSHRMMEEINAGFIAKYFDYRYLPKMTSLTDIIIEDKTFGDDYIGPILGTWDRLNIRRVFKLVPSLERLYIDERCYTRNNHTQQLLEDEGPETHMKEVLNDFQNISLDYRNNHYNAMKEYFTDVPRQYSEHGKKKALVSIVKGVGNAFGAVAGQIGSIGLEEDRETEY